MTNSLPADKMTRRQVCERLGCSYAYVQYLDQFLKPQKPSGIHPGPTLKRGPRFRLWYDRKVVEAFALEWQSYRTVRTRKLPTSKYTGRMAARAFILFEKGHTIQEAVAQLQLMPRVVHNLYRMWSDPEKIPLINEEIKEERRGEQIQRWETRNQRREEWAKSEVKKLRGQVSKLEAELEKERAKKTVVPA